MTHITFPRMILPAMSVGHLMVDFYVTIIASILPFLAIYLGLSLTSLGLMLTIMLLTTGFAQPIFGFIIDRKRKGNLLPLAVLAVAVLLSSIGLTTSYWLIVALATAGGLIASFYHPLGSSFTNAISSKKGLAMSIYIVGGSLGYALAPLVVFPLVQTYGLSSLTYLVLPGVMAAAFLWLSGAGSLVLECNMVSTDIKLPDSNSIKWLIVLNIIVACRSWAIAVVIGFIPLLFINRGYTFTSAGLLLTVFLAMGSIGIFSGGYLSDLLPRKAILVITGIGSFILLLLFFNASGVWLWVFLGLLGATLKASSPLTVILAQDLIPEYTGVAGGLIMGTAVGLGQVGALVTGVLGDSFGLEMAVRTVLILLAVGVVLSIIYPKKLTLLNKVIYN